MMEHLVVPTFVLGGDGRVLVWNRACERLTGLAASQVIGTKEHWRGFYTAPRPCLADLILQGRLVEAAELYAEIVPSPHGIAQLSAENWCQMPRETARRYLAIDAGPIVSDEGKMIGVVETLRDITEQKKAQLALAALATQDGLTGIANRRAFDAALDAAWQDRNRIRQPLSILLIDIDHFKLYNDVLGHQAGDECLRRLARLFVHEMPKPDDLVARYGGEEFALVLPRTSVRQAAELARRMVAAVAAIRHRHPALPDGGFLSVTVGGATCTRSCAEADHLVAEADAALYRAKRAGRNRTEVVECGAYERRNDGRCRRQSAPMPDWRGAPA
ncbi:diguanylate cyclase [Aurantimonas sp. VKM B-3413]|uniref:diguanylate cyclase n=1 Tax=Aurantimonas sp. VKM B-3413 TaxID=2779401 RepID=UPI001E2D0AB4|nr:diguanylate cyclase [Aurantimonas sp. VKM B-3413]MCB8837287.1 diguanylate cyclase [Aurantimonas sp. VKM B-3413]